MSIVIVNVYVFAWRFSFLAGRPHGNFLQRGEVSALDWLAQNAGTDDVVLSGADLGQYVPSRTGARAFLAHWAMTKDLYEKKQMVWDFFDADTADDRRQAIIREFSVDFILMGVEERASGDYDPGTAVYLEPCFTSPQASVYCVREQELSRIER